MTGIEPLVIGSLIASTAATAASQVMAGNERANAANFEAQQQRNRADELRGQQTQLDREAENTRIAADQAETQRREGLTRNMEQIQSIRAGRGVGEASPTGMAILDTLTGLTERSIGTERFNYLSKADNYRMAGETSARDAENADIAAGLSTRKAKTSLLAGYLGAAARWRALATNTAPTSCRRRPVEVGLMAVLGTGLPEQVGERVLAQPSGTAPLSKPVNADAYSNAASWQEIAHAGAKLTDAAGDYAKVQIHQAKVGYLAEQDVEIARQRTDMRDKYANDPAGFDANWTAYKDGKIGAAEPWAVPHLTRSLGSEGNSAYSAILSETRAKDQKLDAQRIGALSDLTSNDVIGAAMAGTLSDPDGQIKIGKYQAVLDSAVNSGLMPKEKADYLFDQTMSKAQGEIAARGGVEVYRAKGFDAAVDHLKKGILENDTLTLKGESRYAAFNRGLSAVRLAAAQDKEDKVAFVEVSKDLRARIASNQPMMPARSRTRWRHCSAPAPRPSSSGCRSIMPYARQPRRSAPVST
jgi:hypothetical protein